MLIVGSSKNFKRLRNGTLLVETVNTNKQADELIKITKIAVDINVKIEKHHTLKST